MVPFPKIYSLFLEGECDLDNCSTCHVQAKQKLLPPLGFTRLIQANVRTGRKPKDQEDRQRSGICGHMYLPTHSVCDVPAYAHSHSCLAHPHPPPCPTQSGT